METQHAGYARVAFNFALSSFKVGLDPDEWRSHIDIKREFNAVKYDKFDWCEDLSQNASKNAIHNLGDAVTRWKKGQNKFPVYKNRSGKCSYQADNGEGTVEVCKKRVNLPKIGWIRMREELRYSGEITKVVVSKCNGNKWYVSITVRRFDSSNYKHQPPLFDDKEPIGIDVGINTLATCSNGDTYDNPRYPSSDMNVSWHVPTGVYKADLTLSERTYHCSECGFECDRDLNAAINLCPA